MTTYDPDEYDDDQDDQDEDQEGDGMMPAAVSQKVRRISRPTRKAVDSLPISEAQTPDTLHGEIRFTASCNLGHRDENRHLSVMLPVVVQSEDELATQVARANDVAFQVKAIVFEQMGIEFTIDEGGVLHEVVRKAFPGARRVRADEPQDEREPAPRQREGGGKFPHPAELDKPGHVDDDLWRDLCETYPDDWYDNRPRKASGEYKSTAADFKRVSDSASIWLKPYSGPSTRGGQRGGQQRRSYSN